MEKVDVLIVGAGPAGSSCAAKIAEGGFKVAMIEKKTSIGEPVQCAEYIPKLFLKELDINTEFISNEVNSMKTFLAFRESAQTQSPGFLIERNIFDRMLCLNAIKKGARLFAGTKVRKIERNYVIADGHTGNERFEADIIVGADGPLSVVGKWLGLTNQSFVNCYQVELPKRQDRKSTEVYFFDECPAGYGWVFPKKDTLNVGCGVSIKFNKNPREVLDKFLKLIKLDKHRAIRLTKGLIPTGGILAKVVKENAVLVGDAAGLAHPITGAGIPQAVISGKRAAEVIIDSLKAKDLKVLTRYEEKVRELWGDYIGIAQERRQYADNNWNTEPFDDTARKTWVAFKEYYEEARKFNEHITGKH